MFDLQEKIKEALNHGVIKFNIDTDIQVHLPCICLSQDACQHRPAIPCPLYFSWLASDSST